MIISVIISLVLALSRNRFGYPALRFSLGVAGTFLSGVMVTAMQLIAAFSNAFSGMSEKEMEGIRIMQVIFCVPMLLGILALIGPHHGAIRWIGRLIVYVASPLGLVCVVSANLVQSGSEEFRWIIAYLIAAVFCWETAVRASKAGLSRLPDLEPNPG